MNKEIEEMALEMPEKIKDQLDNSRYIIFGKSLRRSIAKIYYNSGYRKIDENCAVITKAELKQYKVQAVREFAENLKEYQLESKNLVWEYGVGWLDCYAAFNKAIDELLKEYEK